MCLWKERRYFPHRKHFCRQFMALCFPKEGLHSLQSRLCLCLLAYKWVNLFPKGFFFSLSCQCCASLWWIFTLLQADSHDTQVIQAIKILSASRIQFLTLWWDFMTLMRHPSYSGQEVFPWKMLHSWFVGSSHHL